MAKEIYTSGEYQEKNPTWHVEDSFWKANLIIYMMQKNNIMPKTICEVGCGGGGEILRQLQKNMDKECRFCGYEISPYAFKLCKERANYKLQFKLNDVLEDGECFYLLLFIDLIEHMEDYFKFLRQMKAKSLYKILHIPLDLSMQSILRCSPILEKRESVGHIHYFNKELALKMLEEIGYKVIDYFYTAPSLELPSQSVKSYIARLPRKIFFALNKDMAARILGGFSLMVLAM